MSAYPAPYAAQPLSRDASVQELSVPIYQAKGWLQFLGIITIIGGVLQALSIVGILFAWLPIWMGVLMLQAGSSINAATQLGDRVSFLRSLNSLKTYFVIQGVMTLLSLLAAVSVICVFVILPLVFGVTVFPWQNIINNSLGSY